MVEIEKCPVCGHKMIRKEIPYYEKETGFYLDANLLFDADICEHCNETFYTEDASKRLDLIFIDMDVWGSEIPLIDLGESSNDLGHDGIVAIMSIISKPIVNPKILVRTT